MVSVIGAVNSVYARYLCIFANADSTRIILCPPHLSALGSLRMALNLGTLKLNSLLNLYNNCSLLSWKLILLPDLNGDC